jgi:hypothetical protein
VLDHAASLRKLGLMKRVLASLAVVGGVVAVNQLAFDQKQAAVLGEKVVRCAVAGGTAITPGRIAISEPDGPFTVRIESGRIASILTRPLKITPGSVVAPSAASFVISSIRVENGALVADVSVANRTNCPASLGSANVTARHDTKGARVSAVRFDGDTDPVVAAGDRATGRISIPLAGDGVYEVSATGSAEIGLVR